jgi:hypothetical protein
LSRPTSFPLNSSLASQISRSIGDERDSSLSRRWRRRHSLHSSGRACVARLVGCRSQRQPHLPRGCKRLSSCNFPRPVPARGQQPQQHIHAALSEQPTAASSVPAPTSWWSWSTLRDTP